MKNKGFSLIEIMIAVAIIGIVSAIAYPSYARYIMKSKRTECRGAVMQVMQQQERYFTQQNTYLAFAKPTSDASAQAIPMRSISGDTFSKSACQIKAEACSGSTIAVCVKVTGEPVVVDPEVANITMQSDGTKGCTGTAQTKCWTN